MKYGFCLHHNNDFILYREDIISKLIKIGLTKDFNIIFKYEIINSPDILNGETILEIEQIELLSYKDNEYYKVNISKDIELYVNEYNVIFLFNYKQTIEEFKNFLDSINKRVIIYC